MTNDLLNAFAAFVTEANSSGAASQAIRPVTGTMTVIPLVVAGKSDAPVVLRKAFWNGQRSGRKGVMWCLAVSADDPSKWPEGYNARILPLDMPVTVAAQIASMLTDTDATDGASTVDENGNVTVKTAFKVTRTGHGKDTKYTVMALRKTPTNLPDRLDLPDTTLEGIAKAMENQEADFTPESDKPTDPSNVQF